MAFAEEVKERQKIEAVKNAEFQVKMREVLSLMGEEWRALERPNFEDVQNGVVVAVNDKRCLGFYLKGKDLSSEKPYVHIFLYNFGFEKFVDESDKPDSINISLLKSSEQVASNIKKRFIPAFEATCKVAMSRRDAKEAKENRIENNITLLLRSVGVVGERVPGNHYDPKPENKIRIRDSFALPNFNLPAFQAEIGEDKVKLEFPNLTPAQAEGIMFLLYGQHDRENIKAEKEKLELNIEHFKELEDITAQIDGAEHAKHWTEEIAKSKARLAELEEMLRRV